MKTTKEEILLTSLRLFAERGFDAVSTRMIAEELGITKGALYRHYEDKQAIFDAIIGKMFELDAQQANDNGVPEKEYEADSDSYKNTGFSDLCGFVNEQFSFWTENEFAMLFRRMITIEQFRNTEMNKLYQDVICAGPLKYTVNLFDEMIKNGQLNDEAARLGSQCLAIQLFAPLKLSIGLFDGGENPDIIKENLRAVTSDFEKRHIKNK